MDAPHIATLCVGKDYTQCKTKEHFAQHIKIQKHGAQLADIIGEWMTEFDYANLRHPRRTLAYPSIFFSEGVLLSLINKNASTAEIRELCRTIGYEHYEINLHCTAQQWKLVRDVLVHAITQSNYPK